MKKFILALLCLMFLLVSCKNQTVTFNPSEMNDMTIDKESESSSPVTVLTREELARKLGIQFANGNFSEMYQHLSEKLKATSDITELKRSWNEYVSPYGYFVGYYGCESIPIEDYVAVKVFLIYETKDIVLSLKFDANDLIDGLWLNTFTIPTEEHSTDFEETAIDIQYDNLPLDAILTLPKGVDNPPVVLLVSDLGKYNHNGERGQAKNSALRDIAHGLAKQGIATLRMNKRFYQYQELYDPKSTLAEDTLQDVSEAISYLSSCRYVDSDRIYLLGHGFSGFLAPKIALDNPEIKGIVSFGGSARHLADVYLEQSRIIALNNDSLSDTQRELNFQRHSERVDTIKSISLDDENSYYSRYATFWQDVNQIDNSIIVNYLKIPILVMHGERDIEYGMVEYESWQQLLEYNDKATFCLYEGLNHMFMPANGKYDVSEYDPPAKVDEKVILDLANWVNNN